jgi:hypothetical protein
MGHKSLDKNAFKSLSIFKRLMAHPIHVTISAAVVTERILVPHGIRKFTDHMNKCQLIKKETVVKSQLFLKTY